MNKNNYPESGSRNFDYHNNTEEREEIDDLLDEFENVPSRRPRAGRQRPHTPGHARRARRTRRPLSLNLLLLAAILIIAGTAVLRLVIWNRGTGMKPAEASATAFDVEVQDVIIALDPAKREGHRDDGRTVVLFLGGNPVCDETGKTGITAKVVALAETGTVEATGSTVEAVGTVEAFSAGFPSSRVACVNALYDVSAVDDVFNMYYVANAIHLGDYTALDNAAALHPEDSRFAESVNTLKNTDFDAVDIIAFMYDAQDYFTGSPVMNENDEDDIQTYTGAMKRALELIQEKYPHIRLVFLSPTYAEYIDGSGSVHSGDTFDLGNGALPTYWAKAIDVCTAVGVSFIDNYYGTVNQSNYPDCLSDNVHLNEKGRALVADHFVTKIIRGDYSEYDVTAASAK
ncbi:SGNH/GDSL hydrolase family protein [Lachnoclostridium sp. Marseille-P6806]|uniref:SGNH/GDSL hydrolase family protein n=1 Tax=Lachnoclostridium sp. Marseille-P6806 TaxID=2364793 RepID=UPI00103000DD|nr:SGNH/GDSL hydrolase family protein [Lachnoclostridium sp. Marseille-P6806]